MTSLITRAALDEAVAIVAATVSVTPVHRWPQLCGEIGADVWVEHENHPTTGAFKVRGGLVYLDGISRRPDPPAGIVSATRGNHGQSLSLAGQRAGVLITIVVPERNNPEQTPRWRASARRCWCTAATATAASGSR